MMCLAKRGRAVWCAVALQIQLLHLMSGSAAAERQCGLDGHLVHSTAHARTPCFLALCSPEDLRYPAEKYGKVKDVYIPKVRRCGQRLRAARHGGRVGFTLGR